MGGLGSGRSSSKPTEKHFVKISISSMRRLGILVEGRAFEATYSWYLNGNLIEQIPYKLDIKNIDDAALYLHSSAGDQRNKHIIDLCYTTPNYGGKRWWFECPSFNCGKRVAVLYYWRRPACRECWRVAYSSQNQTRADRRLNRAFKLADRIKLSGNFIEGFKGDKPKGMHWNTYFRKVQQVKQLAHHGLIMGYSDLIKK